MPTDDLPEKHVYHHAYVPGWGSITDEADTTLSACRHLVNGIACYQASPLNPPMCTAELEVELAAAQENVSFLCTHLAASTPTT